MKFMILSLLSRVARLVLKAGGITTGPGTMITGWPYLLNKGGPGAISIGAHVTLHSLRRTNGVLTNRVSLTTAIPGARIILEDGVGLSGTTIYATREVRIGRGTLIGADCLILDSDLHVQNDGGGWDSLLETAYGGGRPVSIGRNCFIGARSVILKGVTIGDSCVIGAGTVLAKNVPDGHMAYGNPAIVKPRDPAGPTG